MIRTLIVTGLLVASTPALAAERDAKVAAGCTKHAVHTPAGKMVHNAPVYFCKTRAETVAANDKLRAIPLEARIARD